MIPVMMAVFCFGCGWLSHWAWAHFVRVGEELEKLHLGNQG